MRGIRQFTILLLLFSICACNFQGKNKYETKVITETLSGVELETTDFEGSGIVGFYGDYLLLKEIRDTSRLIVYKIHNDSLVLFRRLVDRGRGPREFYYVEYALSGDSLFISNSDPSGIISIYGISLTDMSKIDDSNRWKEYLFPKEDAMMTGLSFAHYKGNQFIVAAGKADTRQILTFADFDKGELKPIDFWPKDSTRGPLHAKQMVYMQSKICSQKDRILYANLNARYMFIAKYIDGVLEPLSVIYSHLPQYTVLQDGNIRYKDTGEQGILLGTTPEKIFAQIGRTEKEINASETYKGYPKWYVDQIEVYDWDGNFIANYQTDRPFYSFAVSSDNHYLYTMSIDLDEGNHVVMRYELE